ncbi:MAG: class I SAM-dependent methyltransferase [Synechococcaceae cyanobacterium]|nr:class I SAM-dependent methyltransferase [Synechococcaceae cyanobacterium]
MERVCEPELMEGVLQARAYADADFAASDQALVERIGALFGADLGPRIADLGCGPGNITFSLAARYPGAAVLGIDGAAAMLAIAEERRRARAAAAEGAPGSPPLPGFRLARLPDAALEEELAGRCSALVSNSLLHHLHEPQVLWRTLRRLAAPGAAVLVKDLRRPHDEDELRALVERHMVGAPAVLRHDFFASLQAAFTPAEVEAQLRRAGMAQLQVQALADRYLEIQGRLP